MAVVWFGRSRCWTSRGSLLTEGSRLPSPWSRTLGTRASAGFSPPLWPGPSASLIQAHPASPGDDPWRKLPPVATGAGFVFQGPFVLVLDFSPSDVAQVSGCLIPCQTNSETRTHSEGLHDISLSSSPAGLQRRSRSRHHGLLGGEAGDWLWGQRLLQAPWALRPGPETTGQASCMVTASGTPPVHLSAMEN